MTDDRAPRSGFHGLGRAQITVADELTPVDAYRDLLLEQLHPIEPIHMAAQEALGLVLAQDVSSTEPLPAFANSAMDGYAVVADDVRRASVERPIELRVVGEVAAGATDIPVVTTGRAVRIMTGAPLPPGADAVVAVETTTESHNTVSVMRSASRGDFVRTVGQDVPAGQLLLRRGHRIRPADIGLLAAVGQTLVAVHPAPRVTIISTGDEVVRPDARPAPGQIRDANGPMLAALVRQAGGLPHLIGVVGDDRKALREAIDTNLGTTDLVLVSGGMSAGKHDHFQDVMSQLGELVARKVAMKPGMPQCFGVAEGVPVIGLPGNPVSSFVSFEVFVRPALRTLQQRRDTQRPTVRARLAEAVTSPPDKRSYLRVKLARGDGGEWVATPTGHQGSHVITSLARADGLAVIPEAVTRSEAGQQVTVHLLVDS